MFWHHYVEFYITLCQHLLLVPPVVDHPIQEDTMNASMKSEDMIENPGHRKV